MNNFHLGKHIFPPLAQFSPWLTKRVLMGKGYAVTLNQVSRYKVSIRSIFYLPLVLSSLYFTQRVFMGLQWHWTWKSKDKVKSESSKTTFLPNVWLKLGPFEMVTISLILYDSVVKWNHKSSSETNQLLSSASLFAIAELHYSWIKTAKTGPTNLVEGYKRVIPVLLFYDF